MRIKGLIAEDFVNYKLPSMFIITSECDFKCYKEQGMYANECPNAHLMDSPDMLIPDDDIYRMYIENDISKAVVIGGLEPFLQFSELRNLILCFRSHGEKCDFVIYTGYKPFEIKHDIDILRHDFENIIIKFGRYIPNSKSIYDDVLGVTLASENQYAKRVS